MILTAVTVDVARAWYVVGIDFEMLSSMILSLLSCQFEANRIKRNGTQICRRLLEINPPFRLRL
jgi:hypothetical protein